MATIYCDRDCVVHENNPTKNYSSTYNYLQFDSATTSSREYGCIGFSISGIPTITSATLYVRGYYPTQSPVSVTLRRMTNDSWTQTGLTWNTVSVTSTNSTTGKMPNNTGWVSFNVTNMMNDAISANMIIFGIAIETAIDSSPAVMTTVDYGVPAYIVYSGVDSPTTDWYVVSGGTGIANGYDWDNAMATVNEAMTSVTSGNTVHIAFGTYNSEPTNNRLSPDADDVTVIYETATTGGGSGTATIEVN